MAAGGVLLVGMSFFNSGFIDDRPFTSYLLPGLVGMATGAIAGLLLRRLDRQQEEREALFKGARILSLLHDSRMQTVIGGVRHHHERFDGGGYPDGLKAEAIPYFARLICVADSYDAMTSDRPYRKGMSSAEALVEIERCSGTQFDPQLASAFVRMSSQRSDTALQLVRET